MENTVRLKFKENSSVIHLMVEDETLIILDSFGKTELTKKNIITSVYSQGPNIRFYKDHKAYIFASNIDADPIYKNTNRHKNEILTNTIDALECWLSPRSISSVMKLVSKL